jgi:2'-5' RNA ligase
LNSESYAKIAFIPKRIEPLIKIKHLRPSKRVKLTNMKNPKDLKELQTSLLIVPPHEVQAFAAPLRQRYAPNSYMQGPAHITLFYPFVPPQLVSSTTSQLISLCSSIAPIHLTLDRYDQFDSTHFLAPSDPSDIISLHRLILSAFPDYPPYAGEHGTDLVPHLTLAHNDSPTEATQIVLPPTPSFSFAVAQIYLYLGLSEGNIPWVPISIIPLGGES